MKDEYIKELKAIVRLLVFYMSYKHDDVPFEFLWDLAYVNGNLGLEDFVKRFLKTGVGVSELTIANFEARYFNGNDTFPVEEVKSVIRKMKYTDFLETAYWKSIACHVINRDSNHCKICGSTKNLQVHHLTYKNHGDELHHLDDLVTLCKTCHEETHNENRIHKDLPFD